MRCSQILIVCKDAPVQRSRRNQGTTKRSRGQQSIRGRRARRHTPAFCGRTCSPVIGRYRGLRRSLPHHQYLRPISGGRGGPSTETTGTPVPPLGTSPLGTRVIVPKANTTVAGDVALDATASNEIQLKGVVFHLTPISGPATEIGSAMATLGGWVLRWDSTSVPNGVYSLQSVSRSCRRQSGFEPSGPSHCTELMGVCLPSPDGWGSKELMPRFHDWLTEVVVHTEGIPSA